MLNRQGTQRKVSRYTYTSIIFLIYPKGHYTLDVDAATNVPGGKRLYLLGIEAGVFVKVS